MLQGWVKHNIPSEGAIERIIYLDRDSLPAASSALDDAARKIIVTAKSVHIDVDTLAFSSYPQLAAFEEMLLRAYAESQWMGELTGPIAHSTAESEVSVVDSYEGLALSAKGVQLQSVLDIVHVLRPLWSAWRELSRHQVLSLTVPRLEASAAMLERVANEGSDEAAELSRTGAGQAGLAIEFWAAGLRSAAELVLRMSGATEDKQPALPRIAADNGKFIQRLAEGGAGDVAEALSRVQGDMRDGLGFAGFLLDISLLPGQ